MRVKNLHPWAGEDFSFSPGQEIELDDDIALARIEAGLCEAIDEAPAGGKKKKSKAKTPDPADQSDPPEGDGDPA